MSVKIEDELNDAHLAVADAAKEVVEDAEVNSDGNMVVSLAVFIDLREAVNAWKQASHNLTRGRTI